MLPRHRVLTYQAGDLRLGFKGERIEFTHRPYHRRSVEARAEYDALRLDLEQRGMLHPLITYLGHVLIGMRRYEIMVSLGQQAFPCIEVDEDVSLWWRDDIPRLEALRAHYATP